MPSLLNGLSAAGGGLAGYAQNYGAEQQKADVAKQLQQGQQTFLAGQQAGEHAFQTDLLTQRAMLERQQAILANQLAEETASRGRIQEAGLRNAADTDLVKNLRALGVLPAAGGTPQPAPSNGAATPDTSNAATGSTTSPQPSASPSSGAPQDLPPIAAKMLGLGTPGSDEAIRSAIAQDVRNDPAFKGKTAGQQAAEIATRLSVAEGKLTDPASREAMAKAIASYQIAPLANFALTKPGGPETMGRVMEINPDYQEARYPEVSKAMTAFGTGPQGDKVRFLDVGVQHLGVLDNAIDALNNSPNMRLPNTIANTIKTQFGVSAPNTFNGLKQIVGTEIEKAIAGGIGAAADRDRLMSALNSANTPGQLHDMLDGFRALMAGQLVGLKQQYEQATDFREGPFAFDKKLSPATIKALESPPTAPAATPTAPGQSEAEGVGSVIGRALGGPLGASAGASAGAAVARGVQSLTTPTPPAHPPLPPGFRVLQ